jgi:hypothetical protein
MQGSEHPCNVCSDSKHTCYLHNAVLYTAGPYSLQYASIAFSC